MFSPSGPLSQGAIFQKYRNLLSNAFPTNSSGIIWELEFDSYKSLSKALSKEDFKVSGKEVQIVFSQSNNFDLPLNTPPQKLQAEKTKEKKGNVQKYQDDE